MSQEIHMLPTVHDIALSGDCGNAPYIREVHLSGSQKIGMMRITDNPAGEFPDPASSEFVLQVLTRGAGPSRCDLGQGAFDVQTKKGGILLAPPGTRTTYIVDQMFSVDVIGLPQYLFQTCFEAMETEGDHNLDLLHTRSMTDTFIPQMVARMFEEAGQRNPGGALFIDHAAQCLVTALLGLAGRLKTVPVAARPLNDPQFALVRDLLMDRLDERVTSAELAGALGFDPFRFTRAFKARTGTTPHKFFIGLRLARAQELLAQTDESIAEIAYATGFSSQAHMTSTFSDQIGVAPAAYRREMQG